MKVYQKADFEIIPLEVKMDVIGASKQDNDVDDQNWDIFF